MKKIIIGLTIGVLITIVTPMAVKDKADAVIITQAPADILSTQQRVWLNALRWCESNGFDGNINPKDRDGTPSWGRYQFKPGTFKNYNSIYGLPGGPLMDGEAQERIVEQMIIRGGVKWSNEFPECTRKLGYPPKISTVKQIKSIDKE